MTNGSSTERRAGQFSRGELIDRCRVARSGRRMVSAAMLLTALLAACLVLGASDLSNATEAASASTPVVFWPSTGLSSEQLEGTGAPLPPVLVQSGSPTAAPAAIPSTEPPPVPAEPGARPARQAPPAGMSEASLSSGELAPLAPPGSRESLYWYSLFTSHENCWQAGEPRESSYVCDNVGAAYLPTGPHMVGGAVAADIQLTHSGDYCNYYNIGEGLDTADANKESGYTGYEPPTPLSSYQEANPSGASAKHTKPSGDTRYEGRTAANARAGTLRAACSTTSRSENRDSMIDRGAARSANQRSSFQQKPIH